MLESVIKELTENALEKLELKGIKVEIHSKPQDLGFKKIAVDTLTNFNEEQFDLDKIHIFLHNENGRKLSLKELKKSIITALMFSYEVKKEYLIFDEFDYMALYDKVKSALDG